MDKSASKEIDTIVKLSSGWKRETLSRVRAVVTAVDRGIVEKVKWKMATRPEGLPVWSHDGILCYAETWKDNIKLIFPKGAQMNDSKKLFNARLNSSKIRAIEYREGDAVDEAGLEALVLEALQLNADR